MINDYNCVNQDEINLQARLHIFKGINCAVNAQLN